MCYIQSAMQKEAKFEERIPGRHIIISCTFFLRGEHIHCRIEGGLTQLTLMIYKFIKDNY